ncbi:50S ribosomal protein L30, partial [Candidatus Igneacidithiobacillus taiwanensis]
MSKMLKVTLVRSLIGVTAKHRSTIRGLGLRHTGHCVELADTPEVRGMIRK